jgi:hypothetical protein
MSVLDKAAAVRPASTEMKSRIRRGLGRALSWRDAAEDNPYSPVACISLLAIVGLVIMIGPGMHGLLAQHW